jgi:hypothetical protein
MLENIRLKLKIVKWQRKRKTEFSSFERALVWVSSHRTLKNVVEFGPGYSTWLMLKHSDAKIISYETHPKWYRKYRDLFDAERVSVRYKEPGWDLSEIHELEDEISLVFVDGGDRVAILLEAVDLIPDDGIVFLHDAHREEYEPGVRAYPFIYFVDRHSCLLFKDRSVYEEVAAGIPPDYSCSCSFCSPASRRAYIDQFIEQQ